MAFAATTVSIAAGATPVIIVSGGGNARPRNAILQNVTTPVGSLALVGFGSATQTPSSMFFWGGTQPFSLECRRGQDIYAAHNSAAAQQISILMDIV